jgi:glyoxylase-like metal-dependent hydrolase (beta-lactamase superfamily II)
MAVQIPFRRELAFEYGVVDRLSPRIRRVIARNPGAFTLHGTGTYIVGNGNVAVIDPGPADAAHVDAILAATRGETITHVLVTHTHNDHSPACRLLRAHCAAPTYGYGPHGAGKLEAGVQVEEGGDMAFVPDQRVRDGDVIAVDGCTVECVYTPGHTSNHLCFALREERVLFTGDHVMGWATSVISPPDGDMQAYLDSLARLLERDDARYWPTHGPCIDDPKPYVRAFIAHRAEREEQILGCLRDGLHRIDEMVPRMYAGYPRQLFPAAARSVFAAIIRMVESGRVRVDGPLAMAARFEAG